MTADDRLARITETEGAGARSAEAETEAFDPYYKWLGIPPEEQPPSHYRLLGIRLFEPDRDVIQSAGERQTVFLRNVALGKQSKWSQQLLNEIHQAKLCLLTPEEKAGYDARLRDELARGAASSGGQTRYLGGATRYVWAAVCGAAAVVLLGVVFVLTGRGTVERGDWAPSIDVKADGDIGPRSGRGDASSSSAIAKQKVQDAPTQHEATAQPTVSGPEALKSEGLKAGPVKAELLIPSPGIAFRPDCCPAMALHGDTLLVGGADGIPRLWSVGQRKTILELKGHASGTNAVALAADGRMAASAGADKTIRVWDLETGRELMQLSDPAGRSFGLTFADRQRSLLSVGEDNVIRMWSLELRKEIKSLRGHTAHTRCLSVSPDGNQLLSGSWDNTIRLWDLRTGECLRRIEGDGLAIAAAITFLPDGRRAISASYDTALRLWDLEKGVVLRRYRGHQERLWWVDVSPDGRVAVSAPANFPRHDAVRFWDIAAGTQIGICEEFSDLWIRIVKFSVDGRSVYSIDDGGRVVRWSVPHAN
jgi:hypothetical protein